METIEYEERVMLEEPDYQKIINDIKRGKRPFVSLHIENIYLDNDESFIYQNKMMLRIRTINNKEQELTLKVNNPDGSAKEINETLLSHPLIDKELNNKFFKYQEIARLITERIEVKYDDYLLVIDKNIYHDIIDYDLEIEAKTQQNAVNLVKKYCNLYNLKYDPHYMNKSVRAIKRAKEMNEKR